MSPTLYSPAVLALSRDTAAAGRVAEPTHVATWDNPLCGDRITVSLRVSGDAIAEANHATRGCALCKASAALMTREVLGRRVSEAEVLARTCIAALEHLGRGTLPALLSDFAALSRAPARAACVSLPWDGLCQALATSGTPPKAAITEDRSG